MKPRQFMTALSDAIIRAGAATAQERAMLLAMAHQECIVREERVTLLALPPNNNPFGVQWFERDRARYGEPVIFKANQFDKRGAEIPYRRYSSLDHAVVIERVNKILRPSLYAGCKAHAGASRYPESVTPEPNWRAWLRCIARIHCDENPRHADQVLALYDRYLAGKGLVA